MMPLPSPSLTKFSLLLLLLLACLTATANATPSGAESSDEELSAIGNTVAQAINNQDLDTLNRLFDLRAFAHRAAQPLFDKESDIQGFVKGFLSRGNSQFLRSIFSQSFEEQARARYLRILRDSNGARPLVRVDIPGGGHDYILLSVEKNRLGEPMVVDLFLATSGKQLSVTLGAAAQLLIQPSDSMIKKVFGIKSVDKKLLTEFKQIGLLRQEKKYLDAYRLIQSMPEEIRTQRVLLDLTVQLAQNINDEEYYRQLTLLEQHYGEDPSTAYMLIDHYFSQGDMEKTDRAIDRMIRRFGKDGALLNLKASIAFTSEKLAAATALAREAVVLEPDFEDAYWTLVTIYVTTNQYHNAVATMKQLEQQLGYQFQSENFTQNDFYAGFVNSQAFNDWLN